jgi:DNA-binding response OmpR family regulator
VKEKEEGLKAGADRYITKPFEDNDLMLTISELTGGDG